VTFAGVGTIGSATAKTFTLTPGAVNHFIILSVWSETAADYATAASSSNINSGGGWTVLAPHTAFTANSGAETVFIGKVTAASAATVTVTTAGSPTVRIGWQEYSTTAGYASVTLDTSATIDVSSGATCPTCNPSKGAGELYHCFLFDNGTGTSGSTSGYTYQFDGNGNPLVYNAACTSSSQHPALGDTGDGTSGIAVLLYEAATTVSGAAALTGSGSLGASWVMAGSAGLTGSGTLSGTWAQGGFAALTGSGSLSAVAGVLGDDAQLAGSGTLASTPTETWAETAGLAGSGSLSLLETGTQEQTAGLAGSGTLGLTLKLGLTAGMTGVGLLSIPQVAGGLVNGVGGASTPQALPGSSQVAVAPQGSGNWQWLGTLGQVTALTYSYNYPGGCDQMTCKLMVPAAYRTQLFNPGWQVKVTRGGHQVWYGKLDEPQATASGWTLTAVGAGSLAANFVAYYSVDDTWPQDEPDEIINRAITRGLPWSNPGLNSSPYFSQFWFGQATDPGAQTVNAFLALICTRGGLAWYVNSQPGGSYGGNSLGVAPLPTVPSRLLVCTTPVSRTLGGYINSIFIRYMSVADNSTTGTAASYDVVLAQDTASVAAHGSLETYIDLSDVGVLSSAAAQAVGNYVLAIYQAASFAGPFTASYGQLLTMGGQPIDPGTDQAGTMCQLVLTDFGYGGEVTPEFPVTFITGAYSWDDFAQVATVTPYQNLDQSLTGLLQMENTILTPITTAST
jgi:hypothetical protein